MKSKASIKGHPIHPMLIPFPIAFFTGTLLFDVLAMVCERNDFRQVAYYMEIAGIVAGLITAIPGFIDYLFTVPPRSSGKKRATTHALLNVSMLMIFIIAFFLRRNENISPILIIGLEGTGFVMMLISGWLGGTLVYRNQIGVDPRYAHAGKWKEEYLQATGGPVAVATIDELQVNQMKLIHINNKRIVIARTEEGYVAFDDHCTHKGGALSGGAMICGTVQCPWHGSQFNVKTGAVEAGPAKEPISTNKVTEEKGKVWLVLT